SSHLPTGHLDHRGQPRHHGDVQRQSHFPRQYWDPDADGQQGHHHHHADIVGHQCDGGVQPTDHFHGNGGGSHRHAHASRHRHVHRRRDGPHPSSLPGQLPSAPLVDHARGKHPHGHRGVCRR